jgi:hypothetical protein
MPKGDSINRSALLGCRYWPIASVWLCFLVFVFWIYPGWFTTSSHHIDPWIYWGTAEAVGYSADAFGGTYYFRRWTLWASQWFFRLFLGPLEAQIALRSLILLSICVLLVSTVNASRRNTGGSTATAIVIGLAVLGSSYFVWAWSTSYHEGLGTLLFLAALRIGVKERERYSPGLAAAFGSILVFSFVTYQFTGFLFPALIWMYVSALTGDSLRKRLLAARIEWFTAGVVGAMVIDAVVGRLVVGGWENLVLYTLRVSIGLPNAWGYSRQVWMSSLFDWSGSIALVWIATLVVLCTRQFKNLRLAGFLGLVSLPYVFDFIREGGSLFWPHTNIYLYTAVFVCLASVAHRVARLHILTATAFVVIVAGTTFRTWEGPSVVEPFIILSALLITGAVVTTFGQSSWTQSVGRVGAHVALIAYVFGIATTPWVGGIAAAWDREAGDPRAYYESLTTDHHYVTRWGQDNGLRMFLIDARPHAGWGGNMNALYGMYSGLRLGYNGAWNCSWVGVATGPGAAIAVLGDYVEMTSESGQAIALGRRSLDPAMSLDITIERAALDRDLRSCDGVAAWDGDIRLLDFRPETPSSASIKVYGYR